MKTVNEDVLAEIWFAFNTNGDYDYLKIPNANREVFWEWFGINARVFTHILIDESFSAEKYRKNRCIGNAQSAALERKLTYLEGFAKANEVFFFHGYNLLGDQVVDVTVISHPEIFEGAGAPKIYIGIEIPQKIIEKYNQVQIEQDNMNINPLLYQYFLDST